MDTSQDGLNTDIKPALTPVVALITNGGNLAVSVSKNIQNKMDTADIRFTVTFGALTTWDVSGHATIDFPTNFRPNLGTWVTCGIEDMTSGL